MNKDINLKRLLIKAGLSEKAANLYVYIKENEGQSIYDAYIALNYSKSSTYRAFEELKNLGLVESLNYKWKSLLRATSLSFLIKKLENYKRQNIRLINSLKVFELAKNFSTPEALVSFETLNEEDTYSRYHDLAKSKNWNTMMAFGNWEDFNNESRCIVPIEKKFIHYRLKNGGKAFVVVTKEGPNTSQIVDYNKELDKNEDRKSTLISDVPKKPFWVNVFEENDFLHVWNLNSRNKISSTFMDCKPLADFYKEFIYSKLV